MGAIGGGGGWGVGVVGWRGGVEVRAGGGRKGNMAGWLVGWLVAGWCCVEAMQVLITPAQDRGFQCHSYGKCTPHCYKSHRNICLLSLHAQEEGGKISQRILQRKESYTIGHRASR